MNIVCCDWNMEIFVHPSDMYELPPAFLNRKVCKQLNKVYQISKIYSTWERTEDGWFRLIYKIDFSKGCKNPKKRNKLIMNTAKKTIKKYTYHMRSLEVKQ